jgi:hypothetical protein
MNNGGPGPHPTSLVVTAAAAWGLPAARRVEGGHTLFLRGRAPRQRTSGTSTHAFSSVTAGRSVRKLPSGWVPSHLPLNVMIP